MSDWLAVAAISLALFLVLVWMCSTRRWAKKAYNLLEDRQLSENEFKEIQKDLSFNVKTDLYNAIRSNPALASLLNAGGLECKQEIIKYGLTETFACITVNTRALGERCSTIIKIEIPLLMTSNTVLVWTEKRGTKLYPLSMFRQDTLPQLCHTISYEIKNMDDLYRLKPA
jgi:hypothetical protein